jgi:heme-degrading monooxygenase HmoA
MHTEIAVLPVREGQEDGFIKAMNEGGGMAALLDCVGCHSARMGRGVENPSKFCLQLEWESVDAHNAARDSEAFGRFKTIAGPFFGAGGGFMEHFDFG